MTTNNFDVLCIGSAKIDIFLSIGQENSYVRLNKDTNELCISYGQKIPVDTCSLQLGGNACNVAVGLSKLQIPTTVMAEIGEDEFSQKIINGLKAEGVNSDFLLQNSTSPSSFSVILDFEKDRTIFGQHSKREHNFSFENLSTRLIYLTSLGLEWKNAYQNALEFTKKTNALLAFNPGTPQLKEGFEGIKEILKATAILFVNKEEAVKILRINDEGLPAGKAGLMINDLLNGLKQLGPKIVVVTDGANGSYAIDGQGKILSQAVMKTTIVEKTGAGDAYASGFLGATLSNLPIQTAMIWGTLNASGTMSAIGAQNGLLSREEMESKLNAE